MNIRLSHLREDLNKRMEEIKKDHSAQKASREIVEKALQDGQAYYGINTGFGILANKRIDEEQLHLLQENLLISHAVGLGERVPKDITRLMLLLKIHSLSLGHSGVSADVFNRLLYLAEHDLIPVVPSKGSLGASGDLAPLAHLALPLVGRGHFWTDLCVTTPAKDVLKEKGVEKVSLQPKDGLALINGTQFMSAYGAHVLGATSSLLSFADVIAATSVEALQGSHMPFDARIHSVRPHPGHGQVAENMRQLLAHSEVMHSHADCDKVQDPYSLRCVPQVHGASRDALKHCQDIFEIEINAVTDNPLVFEDGSILSGGNFHGQPLALAMDYAAIALAELASISERRSYLLLTGHDGLPTLLMEDTGINSGFMIPQYTAAALVSENKVLCHPASVDSIPTCLGQEDHVSMGSIAGTKLLTVFENCKKVLAIEALAAAQALDFRKPLKPGDGVQAFHEAFRKIISHKKVDEEFQQDMAHCLKMMDDGSLLSVVQAKVGDLH